MLSQSTTRFACTLQEKTQHMKQMAKELKAYHTQVTDLREDIDRHQKELQATKQVLTSPEKASEDGPKVTEGAHFHRFSQIHPLSWNSSIWRAQEIADTRRFSQKTVDFCRFAPSLGGAGNRRHPQIFAENRRKPRIGVHHLRSVTLSAALLFLLLEGGSATSTPRAYFRCCGSKHSLY